MLNHKSLRLDMLEKKYEIPEIDKSGYIKTTPKLFDIRPGNICNLECSMCSTDNSKTWYNTFTKLYDLEKNKLKRDDLNFSKKIYWNEKNNFWNELKNITSETKDITLYFAGGEPFLTKTVLDFFEKAENKENINLLINTNLTIYNKEIINHLKEFKSVSIIGSIDGIKKINDYQRYRSKWDIIEKNLFQYSKDFNILINSVITIYNIFDIANTIKYFENNKFIFNIFFCTTPEFLNINILPTNIKTLLKDKLTSNFTDLQNKNLLSMFLNHLYSKPYNEKLFLEFIDYTKKLDKLRNMSFKDINPYLTKYF